MERIVRDPEFARGMLFEGINSLLGDEVDVGKDILRDYINATIGFEKLGKKVGLPPKSLMRMFGPSGNPQARNLFAVIAALQKDAGVELHVAAE
jgi:DNA-binding phage protein